MTANVAPHRFTPLICSSASRSASRRESPAPCHASPTVSGSASSAAVFAAFRATFFARQVAVVVRIEPRKRRGATGVEFLACHRTVIVRIGLKHTELTPWGVALVLRQSNTANAGKHRNTSGGEQYLPH